MALSSKSKAKLITIVIVGVIAAYSYFAWPRGFFPFTEANKEKLNKVLKGSTSKEEEAAERQRLEDLLGMQEEELGGTVETPRGGTGSVPLDQKGGLGEPQVKGDEEIMRTFQQELYRQLYLPYERSPYNLEGDTEPFQPIVRGGDLPPGEGSYYVPQRCEEYYDIYGFYPPGGSCRDRLGDYDPYYDNDPNRIPGICALCTEGYRWDVCTCRCVREDAITPQCFRPECACGETYDGFVAKTKIRAQKASRMKAFTAKRRRRALEARDQISPNEIQMAFSKLQNKAIKSQELSDPPTNHLRYKELLTTLPPAVAKRHTASRFSVS